MKRVHLRSVASVKVSNVDKKSVAGELPVRLCNYTDVYYNETIRAALPFMEATATPDQVREFALKTGDVLLTKDSETPDDIAVPAFVGEELPGVICGYHLAIVRPNMRDVAGRYLYWSLAASTVRQQASASAMGITRFGLRQDAIRNLVIQLPSMAEQRAIAEYLDRETARIDALIATKDRMLTCLEARTDAWCRSACIGFPATSTTGIEWMPGISPDRALVRLARLALTASGTTPPSEAERFYGGNVSWVCTGDLGDGVIKSTARTVTTDALSSFPTLQVFAPGALVMAMYGATIGKLGWLGVPACTNQACCVVHSPSRELNLRYLWIWLLAFRREIVTLAVGGGQPNISQEIVRSLQVPLPSIGEQARIVADFERLGSTTNQARVVLSAQKATLLERRQSLITAAVTGAIQIPGVAVA